MPSPQGEFEALLAAAVDAIIVIDGAGIISAFNPAAERMFGYSAAEVAGRNVKVLMPEPYQSEHDGYLRHYHDTGEAHIIGIGREVTARRADGSIFPIDLAVGEIHGGEHRRFVGIIRDISERKRVEEQLRQREEQLRLVFDHAPLATVTYNADGNILSANQAFCALLGYTPEEALKLNYKIITHADDLEGAMRRMADAFRGELERYALPKRYLAKDGRVVHGMLHAGMVHDESGKPVLMVVQIEDRSRQHQAEVEVRQHRERLAHVGRISLMGEMAAGLAHEINQPLSAISNYAQASKRILEEGGGTAEVTQALDKIAMQALRAGEVIRRLRSMIRKRDSEPAVVDTNELVTDTLELLEADARANNVRLRLELTPNLPRVRCDVIQIQQVVLNLVRNGIDAMLTNTAERPHITIRTVPSNGDAVEIAVADAGFGVPPDVEQRLFTPFYSTKRDGLGLGLSISRGIVEAHGGELGHRANSPRGTVFFFTLPASMEESSDE